MDTMGNTWGMSGGENYEAILDAVGSCGPAVGIYLVGQGHHQSEGTILVLLNIREDHVPDDQVEVEEGGEADGQAHG